jgi:hypothetical protein
MKGIGLTIGILLVFLLQSSIAEDSALVQAAKKEKERRAKIAASKTFTNKDIEDFKRKNNIEDDSSSAANQPQTQPAEETKSKEENQKKPDLADDEQYWRGRHQEANERLQAAEQKVNELQSDVNALTRQFYAESDGVGGRGQIEAQRNERLSDLDKAKAELEQARQALNSLEEEARKAGAPPGWVRD